MIRRRRTEEPATTGGQPVWLPLAMLCVLFLSYALSLFVLIHTKNTSPERQQKYTGQANNMSEIKGKSIWRVGWNLSTTTSIRQTLEFSNEQKAMQWATEMSKAGAGEVTVTELVIGETRLLSSEPKTP